MPARTLAAVAVCVVLAGCFGGGPAAGPTAPATDDGADATTVASPTAVPDVGSGPHRGRGEPLSTNATGTPEDVRYFAGNDTIRYVAGWRHANHEAVVEEGAPPVREPVYEYTPVEDWVATHAADVGAGAVRRALPRRLGVSEPGVSVGFGGRDGERYVIVERTTLRNREGTVIAESNVSYAGVVAAAPRSVTVSLSVGNRSYGRTYPVRVENVTLHQQ